MGVAVLSACGEEAEEYVSGHLTQERVDYYVNYFKDKEVAFDSELPEVIEEQVTFDAEPIYIYERDPYFKEKDLVNIDAYNNVIESEALLCDTYNREEIYTIVPDIWTVNYCHTGTSNREGYKSLEVQLECNFYWYSGYSEIYNLSELSFHIFDYYLGARFPQKGTYGDEKYDFSTMMLDNYSEYADSTGKANKIVECDVYFLTDIKWNQEPVYSHDYETLTTCTVTIQFEMPEYYDGIVIGIEPSVINPLNYSDNTTHYYAFDDAIYLEGTKFFRVGHASDW